MLDSTVILLAITISMVTIFVVIAFLMGFFRKMLIIGAYMGPNATMFAIGSRYTEKDGIDMLLNFTNVSEVVGEIEKEGYEIEDIKNYDVELEKSGLKMMYRAVEMLPDASKIFAEAYLMKYDAAIVKRILRAKMANVSKADIYSMVYEGRTISKLIIQHMIESASMEDAVSALDATPFSEVIRVWSDTNDLYKVEMALDKIVMDNLVNSKRILDEDSMEPVNMFLSYLVDVYNLKLIVRAKSAGVEGVGAYLVGGGYELGEWKLKSMINSRNMDEVLAHLEGTSYAHLRETTDPFQLELSLDNFILKKAEEIGMSYAATAGPMIIFLVSKDYELRNLKVIIKGFMEGIPKERIRTLLVGDVS